MFVCWMEMGSIISHVCLSSEVNCSQIAADGIPDVVTQDCVTPAFSLHTWLNFGQFISKKEIGSIVGTTFKETRKLKFVRVHFCAPVNKRKPLISMSVSPS